MAGELQGIGYLTPSFCFVVSPVFQHWRPNMPRYWAYQVVDGKVRFKGYGWSYTRAVQQLRREE